jgi:hypothetical protein
VKAKRTQESILQDNAVTKLLKFNSGASQMAKTAKYMLDLLAGGVRIKFDVSTDIVEATRVFKRPILTSRDKIFYENISSIANVTTVTERQVAAAQAQPWSLLRLPIVEGIEIRREKLKQEQQSVLAKRTENIHRLLSRVNDGFDVTRETITRDGKETIFAKTVEDMTIEQLTIIVRNAKISGRSKMTKKPQLIEAIQKYLAEHPNESLRSLCGEQEVGVIEALIMGNGATMGQQSDTIATTASSFANDVNTSSTLAASISATIEVSNDAMSFSDHNSPDVPASSVYTSVPTLCPVQECEGHAEVSCEKCDLKFCSGLHGAHRSHICQQWKPGYSFPVDGWEIDSTANEPTPSSEEDFSFPVDARAIDSTAEEQPPSSVEDSGQNNIISSTIARPRGVTIAVKGKKRKDSEYVDGPEYEVAKKLRKVIDEGGSNADHEARKLLNYECYNIEFLLKLSDILQVDIKESVSGRRATREGVMKSLITKITL